MRDREQEITYHRAKLDKHVSYVRIFDFLTHTDEFFYPEKVLGGGNYGQVRLFTSQEGNHVAVKSHIDKTQAFASKSERNKAAQTIEREFVLLKQASQSEAQLELSLQKNNEKVVTCTGKKKRLYTLNYRMVEPYISGMELNEFANKHIQRHEDMALLFLKIAQEANRIHCRGVIHGDISSRNLLIRPLSEPNPVNYIDYGLAYFSDGLADVGFYKQTGKNSDSTSMAAERFNNEKIPADPAQDVFSIAMTLKKLLEIRSASWNAEFTNKYPVIVKFIKNGTVKDNPKARPSLPAFISALEKALETENKLVQDNKRHGRTL